MTGLDEPDAHAAHTQQDHRGGDPGGDRAADHESVGEGFADAVRHDGRTRPSPEVGKDEEHAKPIMRHKADVPRVLYKASGRGRREAPPGVEAI
jgi:hypothetical protein